MGGHIAGLLDAGAACIGGEPVVDLALRRVGAGILPDCGIKLVAQGVALVRDGVGRGGHAVHGQQPQAGLGIHLRDVVVDREADGVGRVVVLGDVVHQFAHQCRSQLGGGVHQLAALNEQLLEQGLAAGVLPALEGHDVGILAAHVLPVGDLPGVDVPELLPGQALDGVVLVHDEDQRVPANGFLVQWGTIGLQIFLDGLRGLVGDDEPGAVLGVAVKAQVPPGPGGGVGGHGALGGFQLHAGGVGHDLRNERDAGRGAVGDGKLVLGEDGRCGHFAGGRGGCFGRSGTRCRCAGSGLSAGGQQRRRGDGPQPQQEGTTGNFRLFHGETLPQ